MKKSFLKYQLKFWLPVYIYLLLIFYFSSLPSIEASSMISERFYISSYVQHIILYAGLALLLFRAVNYSKKQDFIVILSTTLYGFIDEVHQHFVPGRTFQSSDILMDFLGAILALILLSIYKKFVVRK
ncbi:VanZ family protein [Candidatus Woesearchaeota archaeon]|nr:VanZ family protein [Candidatus Woesearchaeota archaeon]